MIKIRIASEADVPQMHHIRLNVRENRLLDPSVIQPTDYVPMLSERGRGWVAELGGRIAGFAVADLSRANIWALFVDSDCEGLGIGRMLHDAMLHWMFGKGVPRVWLGTEPGTRAERFYKSAGWQYVEYARGEAKYELLREEWLARNAGSVIRGHG